jgi:hypothetical protein
MSAGLNERTVAAALADGAADLEVRPPTWSGVESALRGIRRRRRRRRAATAAGVLVSVVAFAGAVQVGVLPYPAWAPAVQVAASPASALAAQPTRGSLADDERWLAAFREHVAGLRQDEPGGESWSVPSASDVRVLFAGDVAGTRLAAIEAPYRWGAIEVRQQVWFTGPAGTGPETLVQSRNGDPSDVMAEQFGPGMGYPDATGPSGWVVLTPDDRPVTLVGAPSYAADGTVTRTEERLTSRAPGLYVWSTSEDVGLTTVRVGNGQELLYSSSGPGQVEPPAPLRGLPLGAEETSSALALLYSDAGLPLAGAEPLVLWAGGGAPGHRLAVLALRAPSGALVVGPAHEEETGPAADDRILARDVSTILSSRPVEDVAVAWQQFDGYTEPIGVTDRVGVLGPAAAVEARLLGPDGVVVATAPLTDGGGQATAPGARVAVFLDAAGTEVARADVLPWDDTYAPLWEK